MTVPHWVVMRDGLEGVLDKHRRFTANTRGFRRWGGRHWMIVECGVYWRKLPSTEPLISPVPPSSWISLVALIIPISNQPPFPRLATPTLAYYTFVTVVMLLFVNRSFPLCHRSSFRTPLVTIPQRFSPTLLTLFLTILLMTHAYGKGETTRRVFGPDGQQGTLR